MQTKKILITALSGSLLASILAKRHIDCSCTNLHGMCKYAQVRAPTRPSELSSIC